MYSCQTHFLDFGWSGRKKVNSETNKLNFEFSLLLPKSFPIMCKKMTTKSPLHSGKLREGGWRERVRMENFINQPAFIILKMCGIHHQGTFWSRTEVWFFASVGIYLSRDLNNWQFLRLKSTILHHSHMSSKYVQLFLYRRKFSEALIKSCIQKERKCSW